MSDFTDRNGDLVHQFTLEMTNLGLSRLTELLVAMLKSGAWRKFKDGTGEYRFLPGEFDYFLTQHGVTREQVMHGIRDIDVKAKLEAAMDERRTGESGYRRPIDDVRAEVPVRPGRPIEPFGYTEGQRRTFGDEAPPQKRREPLGSSVRRWSKHEGHPPPAPKLSVVERVTRALGQLDDDALRSVLDAASAEIQRRHEPSHTPKKRR
jgi:hypothetical protein